MDRASVVAEPRTAIDSELQRSVEIDDIGLLCDEQRRRDPKRCAGYTTDHDPQAAPLCFCRQRERFGQAARFVELDIDRLVFPVEPVKIGKRPAGFVGAEQDRTIQARQRTISLGRQRLLYQLDPGIDEASASIHQAGPHSSAHWHRR